MSEGKSLIFAMSQINTNSFKDHMHEIAKSMGSLQAFTNNLESKVDNILKAQETSFVDSYKQHMFKIKEEFQKMQQEMKRKDSQISDYQNEGKMSNLIKRVHFLEEKEKQLLSILERKQQEVRELALERAIQKSQNKRLEEKVKELIRAKTAMEEKIEKCNHHESIPTFSTEISPIKSRNQTSKLRTQDRSYHLMSLHRPSERSEFSINPESTDDSEKLKKQVKQLRKQNRELMAFNTKFLEETTTMESFFIETVNEIKKNILVRKQVKACSLEDFRKEDKLELLIKILSNDDILVYMHEKIFGKKKEVSEADSAAHQQSPTKSKLRALKSVKHRFPSINSTRLHS